MVFDFLPNLPKANLDDRTYDDLLQECLLRIPRYCPEWKGHRSTDKRYAGDNRLMMPKSPYRRHRLAPRCRLISSWGWSRSQGYGCSPFKEVRELGLERRETVRSLSAVGVGDLRGVAPSTRGPG
ncbi:hypothetical protein B9T07_26155 [Limnospira fusiformis CCALA 023]